MSITIEVAHSRNTVHLMLNNNKSKVNLI